MNHGDRSRSGAPGEPRAFPARCRRWWPSTVPAGWVGGCGLLCAALLSACGSLTLTPVPSSLVAMPAAWSVPVAVPALQSAVRSDVQPPWWLAFNDPLLADLIDRALLNNTGIAGARASLLQARALRDVAAAGLLPSLGASVSAQHNNSDNSTGGDTHGKIFRAGLDAAWELDIFGANRHGLAAAEATAGAAAASLGDVQRSIAAEVALGYLTLRGTQTRLGIAEANLASQQENLQITRWRLQAGLVTALETEQARAAVEQTQSQLPLLQTAIEQTRHALSVLTGEVPAALSGLLAERGPIPQPPLALVADLPAETIRRRPDVRAAELQLSAAAARVSQAHAARLPDFSLNGSIGVSAITLSALTHGASMAGSVLAAASGSLFDGGAGAAGVRAQQAAMEQARQTYRATILAALAEVENALVTLRGDRERLLGLRNAADAAAIAATLARQRFGSGLVDFQVVLETQRSLLSSEDVVAGATAELAADHVRLVKALGGGWQPGPPSPSTASRTSIS